MGRGAPPGSAGVPPAYSAVAFRSVSLRCSTPLVYRRERRGPGCAETNGARHTSSRGSPATLSLQATSQPELLPCKAHPGGDHSVTRSQQQMGGHRSSCSTRNGNTFLEEQKRWEGTPHPGARASRPHTPPLRSAQFPCDVAPLQSAGGNGVGRAVPRLTRASRPHNTRQSHTNFSHVNQPATTPFPNQRVKEVSDYLPSLPHPLP